MNTIKVVTKKEFRDYCIQHKPELSEVQITQEWKNIHTELRRKYFKNYNQNRKELTPEEKLKRSTYIKKYNKEHQLVKKFRQYKTRSKVKENFFQITIDEFKGLVYQPCHYCGNISIDKINGIDRKDNNIGYILNNCLPCCYICNMAKSNKTYEEFITWIHNTSNYLKQKASM